MHLIRRPHSARPLLELVGEGEGLYTEFKRKVHSPQKIARPIAAFANTGGGVMLIGIDDDGSIVGIQSEKEALEVVYEAIRHHIDPVPDVDAYIEMHRRRMVLAIVVPESARKPHFHLSTAIDSNTGKSCTVRKVYFREGSCSRAMTDEAAFRMKSAAGCR
ncbi:MAG: transcriptional regulator [Pelodictyon luteolum]|uniref:Transcriptional regulator n=1 Tax=Pelodictyon luteolum TaxID=1100 RepID=A0A165LEI2_PELLU|nr:ATP-binding protein [Pelodictyon luteolum]KZK73927.1 MAG: transcriptional regulator [Pelodictyon luteolum]